MPTLRLPTLIALAVLTGQTPTAAASDSVTLDASLARPVLLAGQKNIAHLRVSLTGQQAPSAGPRPDANVCIAIDRSGSMAGEKIERAREGARAALAKLRDSDYVSVVAYDDVVRVVVPAMHASDRATIASGIARLQPGGGTGLFAGVVKCAEEVRKFASKNRVNRIVLLSDGMANVGPSSPAALGMLGADLAAEGISVATVGLGLDYNEDLMVELAVRSDGSHAFVQHAADLARFLDQELGAVTAVVARDVKVEILCAPGARPVRVLGRTADIIGHNITASFGKINGGRQHLFIVELEVDSTVAGRNRRLADVAVGFRDLLASRDASSRQPIATRFTARAAEVEEKTDARVMSELGILNADLATSKAITLRDKGDFAEAQRVLQKNAEDLDATAKKYNDARVIERVGKAKQNASSLSNKPTEWKSQRKAYKQDISESLLNGL